MLAPSVSRSSSLPSLTVLLLLNALSVSTLYWAQAVVPLAGSEMGASAAVHLMPSAALAGYAAGVAILATFARDLTSANGIGLHALLLGVGLSAAALAPTAPTALAACFLIGIGCSLTQRVLGCATSAVSASRRGPVIGCVIASGLCGIVLARALVLPASHAIGWRTVFIVDAAIVCIAGLLAANATLKLNLHRWEGSSPAATPSAWALWCGEPILRRAALHQACVFAAFNGGWALFPPMLARHGIAGATPMGIVASIGAGTALVAGWQCKRTGPGKVAMTGLALVFAATAVGVLAAGNWEAALVAMVLLDTGTQAALVANQARAQARATSPAMRGRIAAIVTTIGFGAGALGAALGNVFR